MAALRKHSIRPYRVGGLITILGVLCVLAGVVLFSGSPSEDRQDLLRGSAGPARLLSIAPLPMPISDTDGAMCQWMPASASTSLVAALQAGQSSGGDFPQRKPVRMIRDPYAAYSAVAVDPVRNEVVLTDEAELLKTGEVLEASWQVLGQGLIASAFAVDAEESLHPTPKPATMWMSCAESVRNGSLNNRSRKSLNFKTG